MNQEDNFKPVLLPPNEVDAVGADVSGPIENMTFGYTKQSMFYKIEIDKIQTLEDIKLVLKTLGLSCTEEAIKGNGLEHLMGDDYNYRKIEE